MQHQSHLTLVAPVSARPARILVADADPVVLHSLVRFLEGHGYHVDGCEDGREALQRTLAWCPDLVILDSALPRLPGHRVSASLRAAGLTRPVVILTGLERDGALREASADDFLRRPVHPEHLLGRVRAHLRAHVPAVADEQPPLSPSGAPVAVPGLSFHLLGRFRIQSPSGDVDLRSWKRRRPRTLLKYLLMHFDRVVKFDRLQALFWPGVASHKARASLHVCARNLRRDLEPVGADRVETQSDGYRLLLRPGDWLDLRELDEGLRQVSSDLSRPDGVPRALQALPLLLDQFGVDLMPDEADSAWVVEERARLRTVLASLLGRAAVEVRRLGDFKSACALLERRLALEPADEHCSLDLAECLFEAGDMTGSVALLNRVEQVLRRERGSYPGPRWAALRARIQ